MMLLKPKYIKDAKISNNIIRYTWDEWNVKDIYIPADEEMVKRLSGLSHRAIVALTIASAEWGVFRFENLSNDMLPLQYLEAAWAANIDLAYAEYMETQDDGWRGPVRGPLNIAIAIVIDVLFYGDESANPAENPAWMSNLVEHVLADPIQFRNWREICIQRLKKLYPAPKEDDNDLFEDEDTGGVFVPREVFDPEFDFEIEKAEELLKKFLSSLDYISNPFLRIPEEMIEIGFEGTPYSLR